MTTENQDTYVPAETAGGGFLDENLSAVDTSYFVIKGNTLHEFEIVSVTEDTNKEKTGTNLTIKLKTTKELPSTKEDQKISAGFPLTKWISLVEVPERIKDGKSVRARTSQDIRRDLAIFLEAVEGKKTQLRPLERFKGMRVMCKVSVQPGNDQYPNESNTITFVKK